MKFQIFPKNVRQHLTYGLMIIVVGMTLFWAGRNNNDVCRNEFKIESMFNQILAEKNLSFRFFISESNSLGNKIGLEDCHTVSLLFMELGSLIMMIGGFYYGFKLQKAKD